MNRRVTHPAALLAAAGLLTMLFFLGCDRTRTPEAESFRMTLDSREASAPTTDIDPQSGTVYFSWFGKDDEGRASVFLSSLLTSDSIPSTPARVNPAAVSVNPHPQAPAQVAAGRSEGLVFVAWSTRQEIEGRRFPASDVMLARSEDGGRTFGSPVPVNDDAGGAPAGHTFHDLAVAPDGTVYVSWLDSRDSHGAIPPPARDRHAPTADSGSITAAPSAPNDPPHHDANRDESAVVDNAHGDQFNGGHAREGQAHAGEDHQEHAGRNHAVQNGAHDDHRHDAAFSDTDVRVARSMDGGRTFSKSSVVALGSCQCCRTALFVGDDGTVYLAWRHIYDDNVRDIAFASSTDGGRTFSAPVRVHTDGWRIEGCPHSGPSLAVEADGTIHLSWYTAAPGSPGLRYATSTDGGQHFSNPRPIESDVPLAIAHVAGSGRAPVWVAWEDPLVNQICAAPAGSSPKTSDKKLTFAGTMPAIATAAGIRAVAWQHEGAVEAFVEREQTGEVAAATGELTSRR